MGSFERISHHRLLDILQEKIQDERFINLIRKFLDAGYLENWVYHKTYSGTPQGSVISPILTNIYLDKLDQKLDEICQRYSQGKCRRQNPAHVHLMQQRKQLLQQGETNPELREALKETLHQLNHRILETPASRYNDPTYVRVKFLRYADDVAIGIIGPKVLAEQIREELAVFLAEELQLELNRQKTVITHMATEPAHFLGYVIKSASTRYRKRNLRQKGSIHNVIQTTKMTTGNIKLLVPLRNLNSKLEKYMDRGQPACMNGYVNQPVDHIIQHYNSVIQGWYNYFQLAENVSRLNYARYILQYSLAKTLAHKEKSSVSKVFRKYGKNLNFVKPNGRSIHFFNQPMKQVKKATNTEPDVDTLPNWGPKWTQSRLLDNCAICDSPENVEMHHVRHIRKHGEALKGFNLYLAAINRKQIPVCHQCHRDIHNGKYDGSSLAEIQARLDSQRTVS